MYYNFNEGLRGWNTHTGLREVACCSTRSSHTVNESVCDAEGLLLLGMLSNTVGNHITQTLETETVQEKPIKCFSFFITKTHKMKNALELHV